MMRLHRVCTTITITHDRRHETHGTLHITHDTRHVTQSVPELMSESPGSPGLLKTLSGQCKKKRVNKILQTRGTESLDICEWKLQYKKSGIRCQVSCVRCQVSGSKSHVPRVTCHLSPVTNADSNSHGPCPCLLPQYAQQDYSADLDLDPPKISGNFYSYYI